VIVSGRRAQGLRDPATKGAAPAETTLSQGTRSKGPRSGDWGRDGPRPHRGGSNPVVGIAGKTPGAWKSSGGRRLRRGHWASRYGRAWVELGFDLGVSLGLKCETRRTFSLQSRRRLRNQATDGWLWVQVSSRHGLSQMRADAACRVQASIGTRLFRRGTTSCSVIARSSERPIGMW
jgi:hypothetical protein